MGFVPAGFAAGAPPVGITEPVAGTNALPVPEPPDPSPRDLSIALETTADNLYFQASAGAMPKPKRTDKPKAKTGKRQLSQLSSLFTEQRRYMIMLSYMVFCGGVHLHVYLSFFLSFFISFFLSFRSFRSVNLSIYRSIDLSVYPSIYLPTYLSS